MRALTIVPGTREVRLVERPEPEISAPDEIVLRVLRVGICGTDREQAAGGRADPPPGRDELIIGHEMVGEVVEVGEAVKRVRPGDLAVLTVRRGCGRCLPCAMNRSDMCLTGDFRERGIRGLDGFQAEYVVDREPYVVAVPREIASTAVLTEPLSVVEKAIDEAVRLQFARLPGAAATPDWLHGRRCLVAGLGPIGLLAAMALILRGAEVHGLDVVDAETARPAWLAHIGGTYVDARRVPPENIRAELGPMEFVFEATGAPRLAFNLLEALSDNGVYVLTGIPTAHCVARLDACDLVRHLVLNNQVMIGSVNAARGHYQMAADDLVHAAHRWNGHVDRLITHRYTPAEAAAALHRHPTDEIKTVIEWGDAAPMDRGTHSANP
ncbi:MAG TPA: glucose 1-dehydrogenase [Longimicrobiales bacterium]|nr:glucose 1-dehydrogenase [Longimicrobiales bacterium]